MNNVWKILGRSIKSATKQFKELFEILALIIFGFLTVVIEVHILSNISVLLGILLILPFAFIDLVFMNFWFDITSEWDF
jgi:hypothetical protein